MTTANPHEFRLKTKLKIWKIKHEDTAWHIMQQQDDELDIPGWEDLKGASHEAFLMNQRITSETFRYKFLEYNRTWLINQLPQLLTPRTMRRSRPYLINQFARIINARYIGHYFHPFNTLLIICPMMMIMSILTSTPASLLRAAFYSYLPHFPSPFSFHYTLIVISICNI